MSSVHPLRRSLVLAGLMAGAATAAVVVRPGAEARRAPAYRLEDVVPRRFGGWREEAQSVAAVVNPQTQELLDRLYSQLLTRVYADASGYRVMLSLAYGDDQRGGLQAHMPEICYPAQGFEVHSNALDTLDTGFGRLSVRRLSTSKGARLEPVTYWFTYGGESIKLANRFERRLIELRLAMAGQLPDGLLVRVSSLDANPKAAFSSQDRFIVELLGALPGNQRHWLSGLQG